jgi:hypothetical protein
VERAVVVTKQCLQNAHRISILCIARGKEFCECHAHSCV